MCGYMTRIITIITIGMIMRTERIGGIWRRSVMSIGSIRSRVIAGRRHIGRGGIRIQTEWGGNRKLEKGNWKMDGAAGGALCAARFVLGERRARRAVPLRRRCEGGALRLRGELGWPGFDRKSGAE